MESPSTKLPAKASFVHLRVDTLDVDDFTVAGVTTLDSAQINDLVVGTTLDVGGNVDVTGTTTIGGIATIDTLDVTNDADVGGNVDITGATTVGGTLTANQVYVAANTFLGGTLTTQGPTTINTNLTVTGAATLNTLTVNGATTFASNVDVTGNLDVQGDLFAQSHVIVSGNLTANGHTTMENMDVATLSTFHDTLTVHGDITAATNAVTAGLPSKFGKSYVGKIVMCFLTPDINSALNPGGHLQLNFDSVPNLSDPPMDAGVVGGEMTFPELGTYRLKAFFDVGVTSAALIDGEMTMFFYNSTSGVTLTGSAKGAVGLQFADSMAGGYIIDTSYNASTAPALGPWSLRLKLTGSAAVDVTISALAAEYPIVFERIA